MTTEKIDEIKKRLFDAQRSEEFKREIGLSDIGWKDNIVTMFLDDIAALLDEIERLTVKSDFDYAEAMSLVLSHEGRIERLQCELKEAKCSHPCPNVNQKNEIDHMTRERDAAVKDLQESNKYLCNYCRYENVMCHNQNGEDDMLKCWQWRGLTEQKEIL